MQVSGRKSVPTPLLLTSWPRPLSDDCISSQIEELPPTYEEIKNKVEHAGDIIIRIVTWNQQARDPPSPDELSKYLFQCRRYHLIAVGTQECENTFAKSIIVPSKVKWEAALVDVLGTDYDCLHSHSLQACHIIIFVHKAISHLVSNIRSLAVPTGIGDKLGNKGGIGVALSIAESSFCFVNAHLAAHQHAAIRRISEFKKISSDMAKMQQNDCSTTSSSSCTGEEDCFIGNKCNKTDGSDPDFNLSNQLNDDMRVDSGSAKNPLVDAFDHVFWFGDLNFRVNGTREVVDGMLENHMHDALLCNDELTMLMRFNRIFSGLTEGPLNFFPTYKFDHGSDHYDSSQKRRVPSWTDRILFKANFNTQLLSYCSAPHIKSSDHRPVYATFKSKISFGDGTKEYLTPAWEIQRETKSEVCCVS